MADEREQEDAVWTDKHGVTHKAVGSRMISFDPGTFIMWTACGSADIPANGAWRRRDGIDVIDCPNCPTATRDDVLEALK